MKTPRLGDLVYTLMRDELYLIDGIKDSPHYERQIFSLKLFYGHYNSNSTGYLGSMSIPAHRFQYVCETVE